MSEEVEFVVHEVDETGHGRFVGFVDGDFQVRCVAVFQFSGRFLAVGFNPGGVAAAVADEVQRFSNEKNFVSKVFGYDAGDLGFI